MCDFLETSGPHRSIAEALEAAIAAIRASVETQESENGHWTAYGIKASTDHRGALFEATVRIWRDTPQRLDGFMVVVGDQDLQDFLDGAVPVGRVAADILSWFGTDWVTTSLT